MGDALRVEGLRVWRGRSEIVRSVDLTIPEGALVSLVGSNGAGKTTLIEGILGSLPSRAATLEFQGRDLKGTKPWERVRSGIVVVPQDRHLFPEMTVEENLTLGRPGPRTGSSLSFDLDDMYALFPRLRDRVSQQAATLSGGERSMLAMARGLMLQPALLVLDEPSLGLAPVIVDAIMHTIAEVNRLGLSVLLVEQNVHQALALASEVSILDGGEVVQAGSVDDVRGSGLLESGFLGRTSERS